MSREHMLHSFHFDSVSGYYLSFFSHGTVEAEGWDVVCMHEPLALYFFSANVT